MLKSVILVVGLPCSGKTTFAQDFCRENPSYALLDDPRDWPTVMNFLQTYSHVIITDPHLTRSAVRVRAISRLKESFPGIDVSCIFFANDPQQCLLNMKFRPEKLVKGAIREMSRWYEIPPESHTIPVYNPKRGENL